MKVTVKGHGAVSLTQQHFVATGGQASVYVKDGTAYKIYTDPKNAIPDAKFKALSAIKDPAVIKPESLLLNERNTPIGYTMRAVADNYSLCQFFTRSFRDRNKVTQGQIVELAEKLRIHVDNVHAAGILIVDLNELNILVPHAANDTFLIDVDSYQTKGFPATVIMPSVRDHSVRAKDFSPLSDWFSFAVLAFQLFVGAHPYKGVHPASSTVPKDDQLAHRMTHNISAFRADVRLPKCCYPVDVIPQAFRDWLRAVLDDGKRLAPPSLHGAPVALLATSAGPLVVAGGSLAVAQLLDLEGRSLVQYMESGGTALAMTAVGGETRIEIGGRLLLRQFRDAGGHTQIGFTPKLNRPVALDLRGGCLGFQDLEARTHELLEIRADEIAKSGERFYIRNGGQVLEVEFAELNTKTIVTASHVVASVMERASRLYEGCCIQSMLGSVFVSLFQRPKAGYQVRIPELDAYKVVDAKFDGGVLMVVGAKAGKYDRLIFRFDAEFATYDLRTIADVTPSGLNFVTLASGVCVSITEDEKIEAFAARKGSAGVKVVDDPAIGNDMRLLKVGGKAGFERAGRVYTMTLK
jgi:hypothetical protein